MAPENVKNISWAVMAVSVVVGTVVVALLVSKTVESVVSPASVEITRTFSEFIGRVKGDTGNRLLVAEIENVEMCEMTAVKKYRFLFSDEEVAVRASQQVLFRYYIDIDGAWDVEVRGDLVKVRAPRIQPLLPPSPRNETLRIEMSAGGSFWKPVDAGSVEEVRNDAIASLAQFMNLRAMDKAKLDLVEDKAKAAIRNFVIRWVARDERLRNCDFLVIYGNDRAIEVKRSEFAAPSR